MRDFAHELFGTGEGDGSREEDRALYSALAAIIYPKDLAKCETNAEERALSQVFHDCLYRYSRAKLETLFENRALCFLFQHFAKAAEEDLEECEGAFHKNRDTYVRALQEMCAAFAPMNKSE